MTLGERIKERRQAKHLTAAELARLSGYSSRSSISRIEHGVNGVPLTKINKLAEALETTTGYLIGLTDNPERRAK